jgi:hypothetical protein
MPRHELLNNVAHRDLRVDLGFGPGFGDAVAMVPAFATELAELQREYPVFFRPDPAGAGWQAVVLLGFEQGENLFLQDGRWNAAYLPGAVAKGPFLIGFQEQDVEGELRREPVIHVDLEHPRVATGDGEAVFLPQGGNSPYLEHVAGVLRGIRDGVELGRAMFAAFDAAGLIQPVALDVQLDDTHRVSVKGLHGIDRERLAALDATTLERLNRAGFLEGAYLVLASMHNVRRLMAEKQRRLKQGAADAPGRAA